MTIATYQKSPCTDDVNALAHRASRGETKALEELLSCPAFRKRVRIICRKLCNTYPPPPDRDADDLEQELHIRISKSIMTFRGPVGFASWLYRIAKNLHIRALERQNLERRSASVTFPNPSSDIEKRTLLLEALDRLSPREKDVIRLRTQDYTIERMAETLGISKATVYRNLITAQKFLLASIASN